MDWSKVKTLLDGNVTDYIIYGAIVAVTLVGVFKCLLPLWASTGSTRRAIRRLQADAGKQTGEKPVWQESRFMGRRLRGSWLRFLQNAEQLDRRGLPCNVEDYINDDTVTYGPGNAQLAEMIPNLLTSLGILGTFIGLMRGLSALNFENAENIIAGIPTLLQGMRFAFGTSVAGVSCSIVFNMVNRVSQGSSFRAVDEFVENFTALAMKRPLDNDVQLICQNQDSNHMMSTMTEALPEQISSAIGGSIDRAMTPIARSMDNFLIGATRGQVEGVGRIVASFVAQMNDSLDDQFLALGRTMAQVNQHQQMSLDSVADTLRSVEAIAGDVTRMHGVSESVLTRFESYIREIGDARRRDEGFEASTQELMDRLRAASDSQMQTLQQLQGYRDNLTRALEAFETKSRDALTDMADITRAQAGDLASVGKTMRDSGDQLAHSYQHFVEDVVEGLSRSLGLFEQNMNALLASFSKTVEKQQGQDGADVIASLSGIQRTLGAIQASLEQGRPEE